MSLFSSRVSVFVVSMFACLFPYLSVRVSPFLRLSVNSLDSMLNAFSSKV